MIAIANDAELEAALEEALSLFGDGSTRPDEQAHLTQLLQAIQAYKPAEPTSRARAHPRVAELGRRLNSLDAERRKDRPDNADQHFSTGGFIFPG